MEKVGMISAILFSILGAVLIIRSYFPIVQDLFVRGRNRTNQNAINPKDEIDIKLGVLGSAASSKEKATAFLSLMSISYVLVHTIVNKGNCYNDEIQSKKFQKSLTPELIQRLMGLEGQYE